MSEIKYGPAAAESRSHLPNEALKKLFDWQSEQLRDRTDGDFRVGIEMASLMQAIGCRMPNASYWQVVQLAHTIMSEPGWNENRPDRLAEADRNLAAANEEPN